MKLLETNLAYLLQESVLMQEVAKGSDRQEIHEKLRVFSHSEKDLKLDKLIKFLENDPEISFDKAEAKKLNSLNSCFGAANLQCKEFFGLIYR